MLVSQSLEDLSELGLRLPRREAGWHEAGSDDQKNKPEPTAVLEASATGKIKKHCGVTQQKGENSSSSSSSIISSGSPAPLTEPNRSHGRKVISRAAATAAAALVQHTRPLPPTKPQT